MRFAGALSPKYMGGETFFPSDRRKFYQLMEAQKARKAKHEAEMVANA